MVEQPSSGGPSAENLRTLLEATRTQRSRLYSQLQQLEARPESWTADTAYQHRELQFALSILDELLKSVIGAA